MLVNIHEIPITIIIITSFSFLKSPLKIDHENKTTTPPPSGHYILLKTISLAKQLRWSGQLPWKQAHEIIYLCSCPTPATKNRPELENFRLLTNPGCWKKHTHTHTKIRYFQSAAVLNIWLHQWFRNWMQVARAYHWYTEQRLQTTEILCTFPQLHQWIVWTCTEKHC